MSIKPKIAVVTGSSTGIGKALSVKLSKRGYFLVLISRNKSKLHKISEEINDNCLIIPSDLTQKKSINKIKKEIDKLQNIDILINNAGIGIFNKLQNISEEEWDMQIDLNLKASFLMSKMIVPKMIENRSGKIVFINSVAGINAYPLSSAYVASKFGLRGFTSSLREELREHNIKVISVHPGAIDTPFWNNVNVDFPRKEMISADDLADSIINSILAKNNVVHEEIVIRRTAGDF